MSESVKQDLVNESSMVGIDPVLNNQLSSTMQTLQGGGNSFQALEIESLDIQPKDEVEKMIAAQMIAAHTASMQCMSEAWQISDYSAFSEVSYTHSPDTRNQFMRTACKLTKAYCDLVMALNRHRGRLVEQKITVQYVQINNAG